MATPTPTPIIDEDTRRYRSVQDEFDKLTPGAFGLAQWENMSDAAKKFLYESLVLTLGKFRSQTPTPTPTQDPDLPDGWDKQTSYIRTPTR